VAAAGTDQQPEPKCPRCGYDLRGLAQQWRESCPLDGRCSECGLTFEWADVLSPKRIVPKWFVEYSQSISGFVGRTFATLMRSLRPATFWREVQMWYSVRWPLLVAYLLLCALIPYFILGAANAILYGWNCWRHGGLYVHAWSQTPFSIVHFILTFVIPYGRFAAIDLPRPDEMFFLAFPFAVYLFLCPIGFNALPISRKTAKVRWAHIIRISVLGIAYFPFIAMLAVLGSFMVVAGSIEFVYAGELIVDCAWYLLFGVPLYHFIWWSLAMRYYLKMPHAWGVGLAIVAMAVLGSTLIVATIVIAITTLILYY